MTSVLNKEYRIGIYECQVTGKSINKGRHISYYYCSQYHDKFLHTNVIPDLQHKHGFKYPVLVLYWRLGEGDPPASASGKPLAKSVKSVKEVNDWRRALGIPISRKKKPTTEKWRAIIDSDGQVHPIQADKST